MSARSLVGLCAALYMAAVVIVFFAIRHVNRGQFSYALYDAYIHLALAENIARGHYGINMVEASSPSSSSVWATILVPLAGTAWHVYVPLFWNVLFGVVTTGLIAGTVRRWHPQAGRDGGSTGGRELLTNPGGVVHATRV